MWWEGVRGGGVGNGGWGKGARLVLVPGVCYVLGGALGEGGPGLGQWRMGGSHKSEGWGDMGDGGWKDGG